MIINVTQLLIAGGEAKRVLRKVFLANGGSFVCRRETNVNRRSVGCRVFRVRAAHANGEWHHCRQDQRRGEATKGSCRSHYSLYKSYKRGRAGHVAKKHRLEKKRSIQTTQGVLKKRKAHEEKKQPLRLHNIQRDVEFPDPRKGIDPKQLPVDRVEIIR